MRREMYTDMFESRDPETLDYCRNKIATIDIELHELMSVINEEEKEVAE